MGFLSKILGRKQEFEFSTAPVSPHLRKAFQEAESRPLNDFTWRLVVASPERDWVFDITVSQLDAGFTAYARGGVQRARHNAASMIFDAIKGGSLDDSAVASASVAFFDRDFTVGANKEKTRETAWNTLALDCQCKGGSLQVTRSAHRLTFPFGPLLLDHEEVMNRLIMGMK